MPLKTKVTHSTTEEVEIPDGYYKAGSTFMRVKGDNIFSVLQYESIKNRQLKTEGAEWFSMPGDYEPATEQEFNTAFETVLGMFTI